MKHTPLFVVLAIAGALPAQTTFGSANYPAGPAPTAIARGDLDGDGDGDLAHVHTTADTVRANLNAGTGTSWTNVALFGYAAGSRPVELAIDDLDGSGRPDVAVVLNGVNRVSIHRATGAWPGFSAPQLVAVGGSPIEVVAFDLELDGDRDLAVLCQSPPSVDILRNNGAGVFTNAATLALSISPHAITAGNVNANGPADLIVTGSAGGAFADVLLNQSSTAVSFLPEQPFAVDARPFGVCTGDFDGNGFVDIATSNAAFSTASVLLNDATAVSPATVNFVRTDYPLAPGTISGPGTEIECADFDCDSDADLAVACNGTSNVAFLWNNGAGAFSVPYTAPAPSNDSDLVIADLDGDGWNDVATASGGSNAVSVLLNNFNAGCCQHLLRGGIADSFSNAMPAGAEDACPGPQLLGYYGGPRRDFDGPVVCSRVFLHTFGRLPAHIKSARLRMVVRADCSSPGDVFALGLDAATNKFAFVSTMGALTSSPWTAGTTAGLTLDLANLPGGTNLLPKLVADGRLDIFNRSNTAFDYIDLSIQTCAKAPRAMGLSATPYVTPGTWTWSVSGAPPSGAGYVFIGPAVGAGPSTIWGQFCLLSPMPLQGFTTNGSGTGSTSLTIPVPLALPCLQLSAQAVAWDIPLTTVAFSNTWTQQVFD